MRIAIRIALYSLMLSGCTIWLPAPPVGSEIHSLGYVDLGVGRIYGSRNHTGDVQRTSNCGLSEAGQLFMIAGRSLDFEILISDRESDNDSDTLGIRTGELLGWIEQIEPFLVETGLELGSARVRVFVLAENCSHNSLEFKIFSEKPDYRLVFAGQPQGQIARDLLHEAAHLAIQETHGIALPPLVEETSAYLVELAYALDVLEGRFNSSAVEKISISHFACNKSEGVIRSSLAGRELATLILSGAIHNAAVDLGAQEIAKQVARNSARDPHRYICDYLE